MKHPFQILPDRPTLFITGDYELFLGANSGTPNACLLEPTNRLAALLERYSKRLILFVDVMYLWRLREQALKDSGAANDLKLVTNHLKELLKRGHSLQLHLHTHWLDAVWNGGTWSFVNVSRYSLASLSAERDPRSWSTVIGAVTLGKRLLEDLAREVEPSYQVTCFRAGGLVVQPFNLIRTALTENDLWVDSSVAPGLYGTVPGRSYDFRDTPDRDQWPFEDDPTRTVPNGRFLEVPAATYWVNPLNKLATSLHRKWHRSKTSPWGDGAGLMSSTPKPLHEKLRGNHALITYDYLDGRTMVRELTRRADRGDKCLTILGHPKFLTPYGLQQLDTLLAEGRARGWA